ncbi:T9SS type A sorting domain-containing protein [candidate division WOR-3 bacterium]|nr:T9SS type A sorting domain-containing protein [candidate division WOR-3 bacterium]
MKTFQVIAFFLLISANQLFLQNPDTLWLKHYGGPLGDYGNSIALTNDGGFVLAGFTFSYTPSFCDAWILRFDSSGELSWDSTYGYESYDYPDDIIQTFDGGFAFAGTSCPPANYYGDFYIAKISGDGNFLWDLRIGDSQWEEGASALLETQDSEIVAVGFTYFQTAGLCDAWLVRIDNDGNLLWDSTYGGSGSELPTCMVQSNSGDFVIAGHKKLTSSSNSMGWFLIIDRYGVVTHEKTFPGAQSAWFENITRTQDGCYILAGTMVSSTNGKFDGWIVKVDSQGNEMWSKVLGGPESDDFWSVEELPGGDLLLTGTTSSYPANSADVWIVRTDSAGNQIWSYSFGGAEIDEGHDIKAVTSSIFLVTGSSETFCNGISDLIVAKITDAVTIVEENPLHVFSPEFLTVSPNPFRGSAQIEFFLRNEDEVQVSVLDLSGRIVKIISDCTLGSGSLYFSWDGTDETGMPVHSGIYFLNVMTEESAVSEELILIR